MCRCVTHDVTLLCLWSLLIADPRCKGLSHPHVRCCLFRTTFAQFPPSSLETFCELLQYFQGAADSEAKGTLASMPTDEQEQLNLAVSAQWATMSKQGVAKLTLTVVHVGCAAWCGLPWRRRLASCVHELGLGLGVQLLLRAPGFTGAHSRGTWSSHCLPAASGCGQGGPVQSRSGLILLASVAWELRDWRFVVCTQERFGQWFLAHEVRQEGLRAQQMHGGVFCGSDSIFEAH